MKKIETMIEITMYRSRWILAPIYLGLSFALLALGMKFFQEVVHLLPHVFAMAEADIILVVLSPARKKRKASIHWRISTSRKSNWPSRWAPRR